MRFAGQHVIVTGGSSGIGKATARVLVREGAHVSIIARDEARLAQALAELESEAQDGNQRLLARSVDLTDWEATQDAFSALTSDGHPPDLLVNAAGYCHPGYFVDLPIEVFRESMAVDYFGTLYPTKAVASSMVARGKGHIVNFSSVAGFQGLFGFSAYSPAKYAVSGFTETLRQEMLPHGVYVSLVFPPTTKTPALERENRLKPPECAMIEGQIKVRSPEEVAKAVVRGIERRKRYILPGFDTKFYFLAAHLPKWLIAPLEWYLIDRIILRSKQRQGPA